MPGLGRGKDDNTSEGRTAHARARAMTSDEAADAWLRFLLRVGRRVDGAMVRVIAERLANANEPDELLALSADLIAIAGVVAEEATCDAPATSC
jgi:hypothetical protein